MKWSVVRIQNEIQGEGVYFKTIKSPTIEETGSNRFVSKAENKTLHKIVRDCFLTGCFAIAKCAPHKERGTCRNDGSPKNAMTIGGCHGCKVKVFPSAKSSR